MRLLAVVFVLLSASLVYNQSPENRQYEAQVEQPKPNTSVPTTVVQQREAKAERNDPYDPRKDCLYRAYLLATILGVFAALGGIYAIYKQTEATKEAAEATARSAKATEDSVKLQQVALKQWINIGHWEAVIDNGNLLSIFFRLTNPTNIPLTLRAIRFKYNAGQETEYHETEVGSVLAPENPYIGDLNIHLGDNQVAALQFEPAFVGIECSVFFVDSSGKNWEQLFKRMLTLPSAILQTKASIRPGVMELTNLLRESSDK
jgi:hypothetical protein